MAQIPPRLTVEFGVKLINILVEQEYSKLSYGLDYSFEWLYSPQGGSYWSRVHTMAGDHNRCETWFTTREELIIMGAIMLTMDRTT